MDELTLEQESKGKTEEDRKAIDRQREKLAESDRKKGAGLGWLACQYEEVRDPGTK